MEALLGWQVELLACLMESPTPAVARLAEQLAGCSGGGAPGAPKGRWDARCAGGMHCALVACPCMNARPLSLSIRRIARCAGTASSASAPGPGGAGKLGELYSTLVASQRAPLPARLRACRLLALCCLASPAVFRQFRAGLERVLQCEAAGGCKAARPF